MADIDKRLKPATRRIRHVGHLVRRFVGSLSRQRPSARDHAWVMATLSSGESALWGQLCAADQRHSIEVARRACVLRPSLSTAGERAALAGVLLHDIGKIDANLGTIGRVVATVWGSVGGGRAMAGDGRMARYLRHEPIGAEFVAAVGSDSLTVALVARSRSVPVDLRAVLDAADNV